MKASGQYHGGPEDFPTRGPRGMGAGKTMTAGSADKVKARQVARELEFALRALKSVLLITRIY
jgi:hypothetical protein